MLLGVEDTCMDAIAVPFHVWRKGWPVIWERSMSASLTCGKNIGEWCRGGEGGCDDDVDDAYKRRGQ